MKATVQVYRKDVWITEKVGEFEYTLENYREKILKEKELLRRANLE